MFMTAACFFIAVLNFYKSVDKNKSLATRCIQKLKGWTSFSRTVLGRIEKLEAKAASDGVATSTSPAGATISPGPEMFCKKRGRRINHGFEKDVMALLV